MVKSTRRKDFLRPAVKLSYGKHKAALCLGQRARNRIKLMVPGKLFLKDAEALQDEDFFLPSEEHIAPKWIKMQNYG